MLVQFVVYEKPLDYPGKFVLRKWEVQANKLIPVPEVVTEDSIEKLRKHIPRGMIRMERHPQDEPQIVEIWL